MVVATWFEEQSFNGSVIDHFEEENRARVKEFGVASRLSTRWDLEFGGTGEDEIEDETTVECEGDIRLRKIQWLLDSILEHLGWSRTESQVQFHNAYIRAALPKIYGNQWEQHSARVLAKFGVRAIKQLVLGMTPRRWGKTVAVASFCAVLLLCVAGILISTFSTGKRASGLLMDSLTRMMSGVEGAEARIVRSNAESLSVAESQRSEGVGQQSETAKRMAAHATTSVFHSYPSSVDGEKNRNTYSHSLTLTDRRTGQKIGHYPKHTHASHSLSFSSLAMSSKKFFVCLKCQVNYQEVGVFCGACDEAISEDERASYPHISETEFFAEMQALMADHDASRVIGSTYIHRNDSLAAGGPEFVFNPVLFTEKKKQCAVCMDNGCERNKQPDVVCYLGEDGVCGCCLESGYFDCADGGAERCKIVDGECRYCGDSTETTMNS